MLARDTMKKNVSSVRSLCGIGNSLLSGGQILEKTLRLYLTTPPGKHTLYFVFDNIRHQHYNL
jgi:hypothetical protein